MVALTKKEEPADSMNSSCRQPGVTGLPFFFTVIDQAQNIQSPPSIFEARMFSVS